MNFQFYLNGTTPLVLASYTCNQDLIHLLVKYGAKLDYLDANGVSPLTMAIYIKSIEIIKLLLQLGAPRNHPPQDHPSFKYYNPLVVAKQSGKEISKLLQT